AERLVKRLVARELVLSFVPDPEQRLWRTVTRTKNQLTRNRVQLQNRLEALLEEAHIKLSSLVSDLLGVSACWRRKLLPIRRQRRNWGRHLRHTKVISITCSAVSKEHGPSKGFWTAVRLATGQILDEFRVVGDNRKTCYATSTLRSYNAGLDRWELVGMVEGAADCRTWARRSASVVKSTLSRSFGVASGNMSILRIRYYNIQP